MKIIKNDYFIPHQAVILTKEKNLYDFSLEKVVRAYHYRGNSIGSDSAIWELEFHLSNSCNLDCAGCSYSSRHSGLKLKASYVSHLINYFSNFDLRSVFFSGGGDPLVWDGWEELFKSKKCASFGISTNLYNFKNIIKFWSLFDFYQVHVTGYNSESTKNNTRINAFDSIHENLKFLLDSKSDSQSVTLKILLGSDIEDTNQYLNYLLKFRLSSVDSIVLKYQQNFLFDENLLNDEIIQRLRSLIYAHPILSDFDFIIDNLEDYPFMTLPQPESCLFANSGLYKLVTPDGGIFPCIAANNNLDNRIRKNQQEDFYTNLMRAGKCPLRACRHYRFSQFLNNNRTIRRSELSANHPDLFPSLL